MKIEGLKGCYEKTGGLFYFARMCSKIRLHADGKLPEDYHDMLGQGFDGVLGGGGAGPAEERDRYRPGPGLVSACPELRYCQPEQPMSIDGLNC